LTEKAGMLSPTLTVPNAPAAAGRRKRAARRTAAGIDAPAKERAGRPDRAVFMMLRIVHPFPKKKAFMVHPQ